MKKKHQKLLKEYREKRRLIFEIKEYLNKLNKEKEHWFTQKEKLKKELADYAHKIKEFKTKRDEKNISIQQLRKQRDKHNSEVKSLIKRLKSLNQEKNNVLKKYNLKIDPTKIHEQINKLERKIETTTDYKKEKKLMEQIKKLKRAYDESEEVVKISEKINALSDEIAKSKKKADEFHKRIIDYTKERPYSKFIEMTKKITHLKKEQEEAFNKFIKLKNLYYKQHKLLKINQQELEKIRKKLDKAKLLKIVEKKEMAKEILRQKTKAVEEKIKQGKKLTTEDLIAFQSEDKK